MTNYKSKRYRVSIWTPPIEEESVLKNINEYNKYDLENIIKYQTHLSDNCKNMLKFMLELSK